MTTPNLIPYVISSSYPDYKRPHLSQDFGTIDETQIGTFFIEQVSQFILDRFDIDEINELEDIEHFWNSYYDEYYMDNEPWQAMIFIEGEWRCVNPPNELIFHYIQGVKAGEINKEEALEDDYEPDFNWEHTPEEKIVQEKMKEFLEKEIVSESDLKEMSTMNQHEQLLFVFNKLATTPLTNEKYKEYRELLNGFCNLVLRYVEYDIKKTTGELQVIHDQKNADRLSYLTAMYANIMVYKSIYNESHN